MPPQERWKEITVLVYIPRNGVEINVLNLHTTKSRWKEIQDLDRIYTPRVDYRGLIQIEGPMTGHFGTNFWGLTSCIGRH